MSITLLYLLLTFCFYLRMSNPIGRPSKYDPKYCDEIIEFMSQGKSLVQFCAKLKIHTDTLQEWAKVHPDFSVSKKIATVASEAYWENIGHEAVTGQIDKFNAPSWIFTMKNRFKWRDNMDLKSDITFSEKDASKMTKEQLIEEAYKTIKELENDD